jgi:hypothetical protein
MLSNRPSNRSAFTSYRPQYDQTSTFATFDNRQVRKQSHSCDQCRKGKRRCDAVVFKDFSPSSQNQDPIQYPAACTYCKRTRKQCTYKWLSSQKSRRGSRSLASTEEQPQSPQFTAESTPSESNMPAQVSLSINSEYDNGYDVFPSPQLTQDTAFDKSESNVYTWHASGDLTPPYLLPQFHPTYNHIDPLYYGPSNNPQPETNFSSLNSMEEEPVFLQTCQSQMPKSIYNTAFTSRV